MAADEWYAMVADNETGPMGAGELRRMARIGSLTPKDRVRKGRDGKWVEARQVKGLFGEVQPLKRDARKPIDPDVPCDAPAVEGHLAPRPRVASGAPPAQSPLEDVAAEGLGEAPADIPALGNEPVTKSCPFCAETILAAAKKCKHCGELFDAVVPTAQDDDVWSCARESVRLGEFASPPPSVSSDWNIVETADREPPKTVIVTGRNHDFPHVLHFGITLLCCGFWLPVWIFLYVLRNRSYYG